MQLYGRGAITTYLLEVGGDTPQSMCEAPPMHTLTDKSKHVFCSKLKPQKHDFGKVCNKRAEMSRISRF